MGTGTSFTVLSGWSVPGSQSNQRGILLISDGLSVDILGWLMGRAVELAVMG